MTVISLRNPENGEVWESDLEVIEDYGDGSYWVEDSDGEWYVIANGLLSDGRTFEYEVLDDDDLDAMEEEEAQFEAAAEAEHERMAETARWYAEWSDEKEKLERRLGHKLTAAEEERIRKDAIQSDHPDLVALYDDHYGGHRPINGDLNERREFIQEVVEDSRAGRYDEEEGRGRYGESDESEPEESIDTSTAQKRAAAIESIAEDYVSGEGAAAQAAADEA